MSKERELLKKILATGWLNNAISCEVEELLAQQEQEHVGIVRTIGGYPDDSEHVDWLCKYKDLKEGDKLYLAPQKREPLSEEKMIELWNTCHSAKNFAKAIEKEHGIGVDDERK